MEHSAAICEYEQKFCWAAITTKRKARWNKEIANKYVDIWNGMYVYKPQNCTPQRRDVSVDWAIILDEQLHVCISE